MTIKIIALAMWFIAGALNLISSDKISKSSYALCWICLLFYIIGDITA